MMDVKPSEIVQFEAAIKDIGEALREQGVPFFHVYQRIRGQGGYTVVGPDRAYVGLPPGPALDSALFQRLRSTLNSSTTVLTVAIHPEIGIQGGSFEPVGDFMRVRVRTTSPANAQEYFEWQRDDLVPALREAGLRDRRAGRIVAGGNSNTFIEFTYWDSLSDDLNLSEAIGQRRAEQLVNRGRSLHVSAQDYRYRFRRDLGFTAPQP